jgi:hypothetical protein
LAPQVSVETLIVNLRLAGSIIWTIPYGKVESKEILQQGLIESTEKDSDETATQYRVLMKAGISQKFESSNPSFYLDASMNQSVFEEGDELEIFIRSTRDCHLTIYNILEDSKIIRLLPNYLSGTKSLTVDENYMFPGNEDRQKGLTLRVHLPENAQAATEYIYIIALSGPFQLNAVEAQEGIFGVFNGKTAFMGDLIGEVVNIPLKNRAETMLQYEIRKSKKGA